MDKISEFVNLVPEEIRDAIKSLGDDTRLAIMTYLMIETDKNSVGSSFKEIKNELGIRQGSLSNHLKNLLASGLIKNEYRKVEGRKEFSFYLPTNFGRNFMMKLLELAEEAASKEASVNLISKAITPEFKPELSGLELFSVTSGTVYRMRREETASEFGEKRESIRYEARSNYQVL